MRKREEILEERRRLKAEYGELFDAVSALLFRHDPIGINFEDNTDEYDLEVGTILPRLRLCFSASDTLQVVHEEFVRWFGAETAGSTDRYKEVASEIWDLWHRSGGLLHPSIIKLLPGGSG
jgi:hypothetical protein